MIGVSVLYNNQTRIINAQEKVQRSIIIIKQNFDNYTKGFIYRKCLWLNDKKENIIFNIVSR